MDIDAGHADIPSWPGTRRPPEALVPVVNAIWDSELRVVTLADLDAYGSGVRRIGQRRCCASGAGWSR